MTTRQVAQLPLKAVHVQAGAVLVARHGWDVPAHYGHAQQEHVAVRQAAGVRDVTQRGRIHLKGKDCITWLHAISTQDIRALKSGQGAYATCINDVGRLIFDFTLWVMADGLLLDVEGSVKDKALEWLDRYLITEDVVIEDVSNTYAALELAGPKAMSILQEALPGIEVPTAAYGCVHRDEVLVLGSHGTGESTWQLWCAPARLEALWDSLKPARPYGEDAYDTLRIEAGHPIYGIDMDEDNNPLEAGLNAALSMDKGCYTGQEVMARLTFRQGPVRVLVGFKADRLLPSGTPLRADDKDMGRVTSSAYSPTLDVPIAIGYVRREHKAPGTVLHTGETSVEVVELPWYRRT